MAPLHYSVIESKEIFSLSIPFSLSSLTLVSNNEREVFMVITIFLNSSMSIHTIHLNCIWFKSWNEFITIDSSVDDFYCMYTYFLEQMRLLLIPVSFTDIVQDLPRGSIYNYILSVDHCLGPLSFLRIWHDNSGKGKMRSWYLDQVQVIDLQTSDK